MVLIANLQYAWTLFVDPIQQAHGWSIAEIQVAFSIFIARNLAHADRGLHRRSSRSDSGPRLMIVFGGVLVGVAWVLNAYAIRSEMLYRRRRYLGDRRRRDLRHMRGQRGEVVPRPPRSRCGPTRRASVPVRR